MDTRKIKYFIEVAERMSFTKASSRLFVTQSALSQQISLLEKEVGVPLFDRSKKRDLKLTEAGELFYELFTRQIKEYEEAVIKAQSLSNAVSGKVKLGLIEGLDIVSHVMPFMRRWEKLYPNVSVTMESVSPGQLIPHLSDGYFDAVILFEFLLKGQGKSIVDTLLYDSNFKILYSRNNPVAYSEIPKISDFANQPVYVQEHPVLRRNGEKEVNILKRFGADPVLSFLPNHDTILAEVSSGLGYTFTHEWDRSCSNSMFLTMDIPVSDPLYMARRKDLKNDAALRFCELLPQWFAQKDDDRE
ncbi:MAG: LysR family transcriptional regulator [Eubacterium sp.]|nr:LysR family transcriptional regulator [Eubacterium sp.]